MRISYLDHSGFLVLLEHTAVVFDCWKFPADAIDGSLKAGYLPIELLKTKQQVYLCVSHVHGDHFSPKLFEVARAVPGAVIVADEGVLVPADIPHIRLRPGGAVHLPGFSVTAGGSSDIGCSFLVEAEGRRIFHAGDLNFWHWQEESSEQEIAEAHALFQGILEDWAADLAAGMEVCFFPVDPRMGKNIEAGALEFARRFGPDKLIPMHFGKEFASAAAFAANYGGEWDIWAPEKPGATLEL